MGALLIPQPVERLLSQLKKVTGRNGQWSACCPVHETEKSEPSLSISIGREGKVVLHCHAGCTTPDIVGAVGMAMTDLFPESPRPLRPVTGLRMVRSNAPSPTARPRTVATYDYTDEGGALLFQAVRKEFPLEAGESKPQKTFRQCRPNPDKLGDVLWNLDGVRLVLYRLPELLGALDDGKRIFFTEGERQADALHALGRPATTNPMGAGKWHEPFGEPFDGKGAEVVILPDNDKVGREHAEQVAASLTARGCVVRVLALPGVPEKGDIMEWLALPRAGDPGAELDALADATPAWTREALDDRAAVRRQTRFTLRELWANEEVMRPPVAIVPRIAWGGRITLLAGLWKIGKSTLTGYVGAAVTKGTKFLDIEPCRQGDVLLLGLEEWIGDPARRQKQFGADPDRFHLVNRLLAQPQDRLIELKEHVDTVRPTLLIIDSLIKFGGSLIQNENDSAQMQAVVDPLADFAHDYPDMGTILIAHARKSDGKARGSGATMGAVDVVCDFLQPDATAQTRPMLRRMLTVGRVPVIHSYDFVYDGSHYAVDGTGQALGAPPLQTMESAVLTFIRNHPGCSARAVRDGVKGRDEDVTRCISALLASHAVKDNGPGNGRRSLYVPANDHELPFGTD
jgi:putative DNA primase/helicase